MCDGNARVAENCFPRRQCHCLPHSEPRDRHRGRREILGAAPQERAQRACAWTCGKPCGSGMLLCLVGGGSGRRPSRGAQEKRNPSFWALGSSLYQHRPISDGKRSNHGRATTASVAFQPFALSSACVAESSSRRLDSPPVRRLGWVRHGSGGRTHHGVIGTFGRAEVRHALASACIRRLHQSRRVFTSGRRSVARAGLRAHRRVRAVSRAL